MNKKILGIDLGTSSVKLIVWNGTTVAKSKASYEERSPKGWTNAIKKAASDLDLSGVEAIGLSSQVGTYIINERDVINWDDPVGAGELLDIKSKYSKETFVQEIAMPHPDLVSYPIPRLMYIKNHYKTIQKICQPKDYILKVLTGICITDRYSMRGLVHTKNGNYSKFFLDEIGIDESVLPELAEPDEVVGTTTSECFSLTGIPEGIKVYTGLNDFFSSLVGIGIQNSGDMFDITGTSEHLGYVSDSLSIDTKMVSGVYFDGFVHYGVTGSSGASMDFGLREFGFDDIDIDSCLKNDPPIFLPYLNGERAPIFDSSAKGVFFGINGKCTKKELAYSVLEGVAMSMYHIYDEMGMPDSGSIKVCGGASKDIVLNTIKAELFEKTIYTLKENDTSALGTIALVAKKEGMLKSNECINSVLHSVEPTGKYTKILRERYKKYKNLYPSLKDQFK